MPGAVRNSDVGQSSDLPEGAEGLQLATEVKDNPDLMGRACDSLNARTAAMYLTLAETWVKRGQPAGQACLEKVLQSAHGQPGTRNWQGPPGAASGDGGHAAGGIQEALGPHCRDRRFVQHAIAGEQSPGMPRDRRHRKSMAGRRAFVIRPPASVTRMWPAAKSQSFILS